MLALAFLLALAFSWSRRSKRDRRVLETPQVQRRQPPRDEITQPLPAMNRPQAPSVNGASIRAAARSDKGQVRSINEDDTLMAPMVDENGQVRMGVYAVADGMGGHEQGEVASQMAIEATNDTLGSHPFFQEGMYLRDDTNDESVLDVLREAVTAANRAVYGLKVERNTDMGTTLVLSLVMRSKAYVANVGDSRAYLIREGSIRQLTEDHSLVERMVASGQITEAEARLHPQRNLIFRALGTDPQVEVDLFVEQLQVGDRILLCSDGLTGMVPDEALAHIASTERDIDMACRQMIRKANDAGGKDNISVVLVEIQATEEAPA